MESMTEDTLVSSSAVRRIIERFESEDSSIHSLDANEDPDGVWPNDHELSKSLLHVAAEDGDAHMVQALPRSWCFT